VFQSRPKEPHYFAFPDRRLAFTGPGDADTINRFAVTDRAAYLDLFADTGGATAVGEGSVSYLYYPDAIVNIAAELPHARLICILRHPADRAFSAFNFLRVRDCEQLDDFRTALDREPERIAAGYHHMWHYRRMGLYGEQMAHVFDHFAAEQVKVVLHDDLVASPDSVVRDLFRFLDVDPDVPLGRAPSPHLSGAPRNTTVTRFVTRHHPVKPLLKKLLPSSATDRIRRAVMSRAVTRVHLPADVRSELVEYYDDDMARLEGSTGIDLSAWRRRD
jgi:hypothetical protein